MNVEGRVVEGMCGVWGDEVHVHVRERGGGGGGIVTLRWGVADRHNTQE